MVSYKSSSGKIELFHGDNMDLLRATEESEFKVSVSLFIRYPTAKMRNIITALIMGGLEPAIKE